MRETLFLFDLDGTLTRREILPELALCLGVADEMRLLTRLTLEGVLNFNQSLRLRFAILRSIPLPTIHKVVAAIPMEPQLVDFIRSWPQKCALATGNVDVWIQPIADLLGCRVFCTQSSIGGQGSDALGKGIASNSGHSIASYSLTHILDKGALARGLRKSRRLVVIGDSDNDLPMLREADISIAFGAAHAPLPHVQAEVNYVAEDVHALRNLLDHLAHISPEKPLLLPDGAWLDIESFSAH